MDYLSLFTGVGGGDLAMQHLLKFRCRGYVEFESYPQKIIRQRIEDGCVDSAPIFGDIRDFIREGYADAYQGMVDLVTGGFPCQPFSYAGKQLGADDPRNMWPQTIEVIRRVRPQYAFLENVPALLSSEYFGVILKDLAEAGYDVKWMCLSASECGANHKRNRAWIMANAHGQRLQGQRKEHKLCEVSEKIEIGGSCQYTSNPAQWWSVEPDVGRVANGVASRVDRLKAIGNGQVSICAAVAWEKLSGMA